MDSTDAALLALLQSDGRLSAAELGRRVNLSQPAVSARIHRLEQAGVITGYRASVDPAKLGLNIHAVIRLRTTHAQIPTALAMFDKLAEITNTYRLTGEDCFLLDVHAGSAERLERIVDTVARLGPVTTSLVLRAYPPKAVTSPQQQ
ncbi:Lrp/AsnC family transcriptional regulator [Pseudonocardia spinosispora]|uniref:Lrp/AsnC family transcriptional regulator n=1 Tax=Pseudonocardia spinosispora TaxID=103441 RepID=UPI0003F9811A|nr:Lrp/AsnC family transcriptional regulator [Pseudonocardia spinosispora]